MSTDEASVAVLRRACAEAWSTDELVDGVVAGVGVLEDDPAFNAGYGSVLTSEGTVEVDAAVVDARTGMYGGVAALPGIRHPTAVAAGLMRRHGPVLLSGHGARRFAEELGHVATDLVTQEQLVMWRDAKAGTVRSPFTGRVLASTTETVGCIVVEEGAAAVGSSTGGVCDKLPGRIGDSAVLGAGLWADEVCAVLCSGEGEAMLSLNLAHRVARRLATGDTVDQAVRWAVQLAADERNAVAAVLAVDVRNLDVAAAHSGASFPVVARVASQEWVIRPERVGLATA